MKKSSPLNSTKSLDRKQNPKKLIISFRKSILREEKATKA